MTDEPCGCESWHHFTDSPDGDALSVDTSKRVSHAYLAVPAGDTRAAYVGNVCDECARHLPSAYIIGRNPL